MVIIIKKLNIKQGRFYKKYRLHCNYCGCDYYIPFWLLKLRLLFSDKILHTCSYCRKTSSYQVFYHIIHDSLDEDEKDWNRHAMWDTRIARR